MTDPRTTFANGFVAHSTLRGTVTAQRYTDGMLMCVTTPVAPIHRSATTPDLDRQVQYGRTVRVLDKQGERCFARDEASGHVGYIPHAALGPVARSTHVVATRQTLLFRAPDIKSPEPMPLGLGAQLTITAHDGKFAVTDHGFYAVASHLRHRDMPSTDFVAVAESLLGVPYLWGGNSAFGIDCSGLVSMALENSAMSCPADSDQQAEALGADVTDGTYQRGDLLFWRGHVAILVDPQTLIHANAHHMAVAYEPLDQAIKRIATQGDGQPIAHKRP
ncbi:C40 family peptidase [Pseudoprimorskyibacter insulae]|uniref:Dipeptidyl-peptidase 6 n=1 Tax=Pseudoprimorskyibacter insulae TaxID=1695997 RepID=A0A2R8AUC4_9RHOB|nr:NlpC/P60 family protein [Pseudoprimorskyibacter insulae]SPF79648.1 Dipeptidyl-peptidase 6 [Pseudoprimorskyibacter insulae]